MKLSLTLHGKTYSIESDDQYDGQEIHELIDGFRGLLVNAGFHPSSIDDHFDIENKWFPDQDKNKYNEAYAKGWDEALHNKKVQDFQDNLYRPEKVDEYDDKYDMFK